MDKLKSRKLWVTVCFMALTAINRAFELGLSEDEIMYLAGAVSVYLVGQSYADSKGGNK